MQYSTVVEKNDSNLLMIIEAAEKFEEGKFLDGIYQCRFNKAKILTIAEYVKEYRSRLRKEQLALSKFAVTFINQYATNNNQCFDVAEKLFNRIRSTISGSKKIYKSFCKSVKTRTSAADDSRKPSVFKRSILVKNLFNGDLFGMLSYDDCVAELYEALKDFFIELVNCLSLCHVIIVEESKIRTTPERCIEIYQKCYDEMLDNSRLMIRTFKENKVAVDKRYRNGYKHKTKSLKGFVCENYHRLEPCEFQMHVVAEIICKGEENGMSPIESKLWPENEKMARKARVVLEHFDELNPNRGKKLDAKYVAAFMLWTGIGTTLDEKVVSFVDDYFIPGYHGKFEPIKHGAVNGKKNFFTTKKLIQAEYDEKFDEIVDKHSANKEEDYVEAIRF